MTEPTASTSLEGVNAPIASPKTRERKKLDKKAQKKDPKSWENVHKTLPDDRKFDQLVVKYQELYKEYRDCNIQKAETLKDLERQRREIEQLKKDHMKSVLSVAKLEDLCRELHKREKEMKEECAQRIREEEEKRKATGSNLTERMNNLTGLINESTGRATQVQEENHRMAEQLAELRRQCNEQGAQIDNKTKQIEIQTELTESYKKQYELMLQTEKARHENQEKQSALELAQRDQELREIQISHDSLRKQVDLYQSQYSAFETTMNNSNAALDIYKKRLQMLNRTLAEAEQEKDMYKGKYMICTGKLIQVSEKLVKTEQALEETEKQNSMLKTLCKAVSNQRKQYMSQLKEHNIEPKSPPPELSEINPSDLDVREQEKSMATLNLKFEGLGNNAPAAAGPSRSVMPSARFKKGRKNKNKKDSPTETKQEPPETSMLLDDINDSADLSTIPEAGESAVGETGKAKNVNEGNNETISDPGNQFVFEMDERDWNLPLTNGNYERTLVAKVPDLQKTDINTNSQSSSLVANASDSDKNSLLSRSSISDDFVLSTRPDLKDTFHSNSTSDSGSVHEVIHSSEYVRSPRPIPNSFPPCESGDATTDSASPIQDAHTLDNVRSRRPIPNPFPPFEFDDAISDSVSHNQDGHTVENVCSRRPIPNPLPPVDVEELADDEALSNASD